ncbi:MAG: hypothetical protein ACR2F6_15880 [Mycobacteriales bacterium]
MRSAATNAHRAADRSRSSGRDEHRNDRRGQRRSVRPSARCPHGIRGPARDGLGWELDRHWYHGALANPYSFGHTAYTGTTIVADPTSDSFVILLTNHVHPNRNWGSVNSRREAVANDLGRALAVSPRVGRTAWYSGMVDKNTATLTVPVTVPAMSSTLSNQLWYDTEASWDFGYLESSTDGGTTWAPLPFTVSGRGAGTGAVSSVTAYDGQAWERATTPLTGLSGQVRLRWRYTTDNRYHGRGIYVDGVKVTSGSTTGFDGEANPGALQAVGCNGSRN